jgi:hypothetical protein
MSLIASACPTLLSMPAMGSDLIARITLGAVLLPHTPLQTIGSLTSAGLEGTLNIFTYTLGAPWMLSAAAMAADAIALLPHVGASLGRLLSVLGAKRPASSIASPARGALPAAVVRLPAPAAQAAQAVRGFHRDIMHH